MDIYYFNFKNKINRKQYCTMKRMLELHRMLTSIEHVLNARLTFTSLFDPHDNQATSNFYCHYMLFKDEES